MRNWRILPVRKNRFLVRNSINSPHKQVESNKLEYRKRAKLNNIFYWRQANSIFEWYYRVVSASSGTYPSGFSYFFFTPSLSLSFYFSSVSDVKVRSTHLVVTRGLQILSTINRTLSLDPSEAAAAVA